MFTASRPLKGGAVPIVLVLGAGAVVVRGEAAAVGQGLAGLLDEMVQVHELWLCSVVSLCRCYAS